MSGDGGQRKHEQTNEMLRKIRDHGTKGIAKEKLIDWSRRKFGVSPEKIIERLELCQRTHEIKIEFGMVIFLASEYV